LGCWTRTHAGSLAGPGSDEQETCLLLCSCADGGLLDLAQQLGWRCAEGSS
jgi:hypothetical protein